jgi:hypothetical protein
MFLLVYRSSVIPLFVANSIKKKNLKTMILQTFRIFHSSRKRTQFYFGFNKKVKFIPNDPIKIHDSNLAQVETKPRLKTMHHMLGEK